MSDRIRALDAFLHDAMQGKFIRPQGEAPRYVDMGNRLRDIGIYDQRLRFNEALRHGRLPAEIDAYLTEMREGRP